MFNQYYNRSNAGAPIIFIIEKMHQVLRIDEIPDLPRDSSIGEEKNGEDIKEEV